MVFSIIESYGDCTNKYNISLSKEYTVGEFIDTILKERTDEWGSMEILSASVCSYCSYYKGNLTNKKFAPDVLSKNIRKVVGHGGWTRMDYIIYI